MPDQLFPVFRSGKSGEWKYFTNEHRKIIRDVSGDLVDNIGIRKEQQLVKKSF
ncbi:MAG: hypothetical protein ABI621_07390 [Chloroflexota bacterium]